jgi:hypothetical protein
MSKHKDPRLEALLAGRSYTWTVSEGGDLASMRAAISHGQTLTLSPVTDPREVQVGDIVFIKWHKGHMMHLVQEIQDDRFLIVNSVGKVNGWIPGSDILGRVTQVIDPAPRPTVPLMLDQLETAYRNLIEQTQVTQADQRRLLSIVDDLRWYADRLSVDRWDIQPRSNKWSFAQNLWYFSRQANDASAFTWPDPLCYLIDRGKECVGLAAEIIALFEYGEPY